jgi:translation initiation factor IF-3
LSRPYASRASSGPSVRINGKIRAREVRVIDPEGRQIGILPLGEAILRARNLGMDLVEVAPTANPPVCRIIDFGKYQYEQAKKEKESKKHQHSSRVKEIQLRPVIDPHDFGVKLDRAVEFLCDDMKVKLTLRFRGREMRHQELGQQIVEKFLREIAPYGQPIEDPKVVGRGMSVMINPLPRAKRAPHPRQAGQSAPPPAAPAKSAAAPQPSSPTPAPAAPPPAPSADAGQGFVNNPFANLPVTGSGAGADSESAPAEDQPTGAS